MKVLVCGAGLVGSRAARLLATFPEVESLVVADLDGDRATAVATKIVEDPTIRTQLATSRLDISDRTQLLAAAQACDLVINCVGPAPVAGSRVLEACIERGTHYVDVCDEPQPTAELLGHHDDAEAAGITAIIGMGASPGITNLLAVIGARHLELVLDLFIGWPLDVPGPGQHKSLLDSAHDAAGAHVPATAVHFIRQITGTIEVVEAGQLALRQPLLPVELDYPNFGTGTTWTIGHPDPITLFSSIPLSRTGLNVALMRRSTAAYLHRLADAVNQQSMPIDEAARRLTRTSAAARARALTKARRYGSPGGLPPLFALLRGEVRTRPKQVGVHLTTMPRGLGAASAVPAVVVARRILDGTIAKRGVFPPESAVDPELFFNDLRPHCNPHVSPGEYLVMIEEAMGKVVRL